MREKAESETSTVRCLPLLLLLLLSSNLCADQMAVNRLGPLDICPEIEGQTLSPAIQLKPAVATGPANYNNNNNSGQCKCQAAARGVGPTKTAIIFAGRVGMCEAPPH